MLGIASVGCISQAIHATTINRINFPLIFALTEAEFAFYTSIFRVIFCHCTSRNLLDAGADVNSVNKISKTPLIYAASEDHLNCLQVRVHSRLNFKSLCSPPDVV